MKYDSFGKERSVVLGNYLVEHQTTVRAVAAHFCISKSTVHKDVTKHLKKINLTLYNQVKDVLEQNKKERYYKYS